jgi:hypothetical protein
LAAIAMALAACGGSSDGSHPTGGSTSTTPASHSSTERSSTTTSAAPAPGVRRTFDSALRRSLAQQGQLSSAEIDCVLNELHSTLPDSEIQASTAERVPKAVTDAASRAALECTNR